MAVDRARIVTALAAINFARVYQPGLTRLQVKQASQGLTDAEWDIILSSYKTGNAAQLGGVLVRRIDEHLKGLASVEVDTVWLSDNVLNLDELDVVL